MRVKWTCKVCGTVAMVYTERFPVHCFCGYTQLDPSFGLGDKVAAVLYHAKITKAFYLRVKRRLRMKPKCGCGKRQAKLNAFGAQVKSLARWCLGR